MKPNKPFNNDLHRDAKHWPLLTGGGCSEVTCPATNYKVIKLEPNRVAVVVKWLFFVNKSLTVALNFYLKTAELTLEVKKDFKS